MRGEGNTETGKLCLIYLEKKKERDRESKRDRVRHGEREKVCKKDVQPGNKIKRGK